jgi:hypothetical protein
VSARGAGPSIYVTVRGDRALVRGWEAERGVRMVTEQPLQWSDAGRGWVVPAATVADLLAYSQLHHLLVVVSDITDDQAVSA